MTVLSGYQRRGQYKRSNIVLVQGAMKKLFKKQSPRTMAQIREAGQQRAEEITRPV